MVKVKICGITRLDDARTAVDYGADALGFIFYRESPRFISIEKAREIIQLLPPFIVTVGVFVNESEKTICRTAADCSLSLVQLHGDESPEFCNSLKLRVIKAFRVFRREDLSRIPSYPVQGVLLDSYQPNQFGGTGLAINWEILRSLSKKRPSKQSEREGEAPSGFAGGGGDASPYYDTPVILSGGLTPENIQEAIRIVSPYAVDVSSGVEKSPGKKDPEKIKRFIQNVRKAE